MITKAKIHNFVWKNIVYRFGIPRVIIFYNGRQFDGHKFREFCRELGIKNHYSSLGHPKANGQIEAINRTLLKIIKAQLEGAKGAWPKELPSVLWAYRTTARTPTGETPFKLAFSTEAVIPVEVGMSSLRRAYYDDHNNNKELKLALDCLSEVRDDTATKDMDLRKVSQATKDPTQEKPSPNWEGLYKVIHYSRRGSYNLEDLDMSPLPHPWNVEHLKKYYQ